MSNRRLSGSRVVASAFASSSSVWAASSGASQRGGRADRRPARGSRSAAQSPANPVATGTSGIDPRRRRSRRPIESRAAIVEDVKRQLQSEMGLLPINLIRDRRQSFVELYSYDDRGSSSYGTAGYLGNGYFITVKHGVIALGQEGASRPAQDHLDQADVRRPADHGARGRLRRRQGRSRSGRLGDPEGQGEHRPAGAEREPRLPVRVRRSDLPPRQRLLEGHHRLDRLRRPADAEQAGHLPHRRPPGRVGRRRAQRRRDSSSASRSAGCRATTASRSFFRCGRRCSGA